MRTSVNDSLICANYSANFRNANTVLCPASSQYVTINVIPTVVMLACVAVVGTAGNGLVCVTQMKSSQKTSFGQLVLHLAIYDFLSCAIVMPISMFWLTDESRSVSKGVVFYLSVLCLTCSMITMLLIAIDRYIKVCKPLHPGISLRVSRYLFFLETGLGILYALPTLITKDVVSIKLLEEYCCTFYQISYDYSLSITYKSLLATLFVIVLVIFVWCYWNVTLAVRRRRRILTSDYSASSLSRSDGERRCGNSSNALTSRISSVLENSGTGIRGGKSPNFVSTVPRRRSVKTAKIVFVVGISIFACCIPSLGALFYRLNGNNENTDGGIVLLCQIWFATTHAVNPIIYAFMEGAFRKQVVTILRQCKRKVCDDVGCCLVQAS